MAIIGGMGPDVPGPDSSGASATARANGHRTPVFKKKSIKCLFLRSLLPDVCGAGSTFVIPTAAGKGPPGAAVQIKVGTVRLSPLLLGHGAPPAQHPCLRTLYTCSSACPRPGSLDILLPSEICDM